MGRRKIEIKPIKDDRNRSVTFLKRKGGLFKKAHELSVLCSVDVAVIIFGNNKKLYQYCSGDVNEMINRHSYYETAHETKGPSDFGKKDMMDDDDDDDAIVGADRAGSHSSNDHPLPHHMQHPPPHLNRQHTASASPPNMPKALVGPSGYPMGPRVGTPQPMTRPSSRNQLRRNSSNLVPPNGYPANQPPSHQNGYAYIQHPPQHPHQQQQQQQHQHQQQHQQQHHQPPPPPVYGSQMMQPSNLGQMQYPQYTQPPPPQHHQPPQAPQPQSDYDANRRQSMPPVYTDPPAPENEQPTRSEPPPPPQPMGLKRAPAKSRSMFTPIGPSESMLAAHFGFGAREPRPPPIETNAAQSGSSGKATKAEEKHTPPAIPLPPLSTSPPPPPSRNNSMADPKSAGMRPKLKVHIPTENSDAGSPDASPRDTTGNAGNVSARPGNENGPVVLPPPSPSHSIGGLLSAGATGPTNPFSRPPANLHGSQPEQTPMSALPSRFMESMLPSPGGFYTGWMENMGSNAFSRSGAGGDNMLPSPLNFQTPVGPNPAPFFKNEPETNGSNKRRSPESDQSESSTAKRPKNS